MIADRAEFDPITPNIRQVDAFGQYTSAAGYAFASSDQFPPSWRDRIAFVADPTGHLLGMFENVPDGAGYRATHRSNLLASADEWFSPVAAEVGPDGHLWVADWYNFIIQHNPTPTPERGGFEGVNGPGNAHENPLRDQQHGRLYRVAWEGGAASTISSLEGASDEQLLAALGHENQFWRLTAQRLLVAGRRSDLAPALRALVAEGEGVPAAHALWTLDGLGELDRDTHQLALLKPGDPVLQRNAVRAIPATDEGMQLFFDTAAVQAREPLVRLAAFSKLAHFPDREQVRQAASELLKAGENHNDEWLAIALRAAGAGLAEDEPELSEGDPSRGREIFMTHPLAACNRCHIVEGEGGPIGPPLDGIASRHREDYIYESLVDPQAVMAEGFPAEISPMPPAGVLLGKQEIRDLMAYLMTQK